MKDYKLGEIVSSRAVIGEALCDIAEADDRVWAITSDCGSPLVEYKKQFADRFIDTGIAEQTAAGIAAGLALSGAIPYIVGMACFTTMRAFEQNRTDFGYQDQPVRILGYSAGMTTAGGSTHYAMEDIAIMSSIVNMAVLSASDPILMAEAIKAGLDYPHPYYMRIKPGKGEEIIYEPGLISFQIGKGILAREGKDITIVAHGSTVALAIKLADKLAAEGISVRVIDMFTIKPIDKDILRTAIEDTGKLIVWEDHFIYGGLATAIVDLMVDECLVCKKFVRVGIPMVYPGFGPEAGLYEYYNMDSASVERIIRENI